MKEKPLLGQQALVTGSARRVGKAFALALAEAGCDVIIHHGKSDAAAAQTALEVEQRGRRAVVLQADLRSIDAIAQMAKEATSAFPKLNILVNSASTYPKGDFLEAGHHLQTESAESWDESMNVNARAPFFLIQQLAPQLEGSGNGSIVNIIDRSAFVPFRSRAAHSVSKAALLSITKLAAVTLAPKVRVNAIELGAILPGDEMTPEEREKLRWGGVESAVSALLFVLSTPFVNGETIGVKGDAFTYGGQ
ncbi:MAG: SDR family NAD(P)-dependent oxidoreductase [Deltaproteobacteria bacterium]|nr:SDR family NAD(P)-dependent oxidoreductase [Deltaproteobacteria bacterium]